MRVLLIIVFLTLSYNGYGQKEKDSLWLMWNNTKLESSARANAFRELISENYSNRKTDSAYILVKDLIDFTDKNRLEKEKADALILLGNIYHIFNDKGSAVNCFNKSLKIYKELDYKKGIAAALNSIGVSYRKIYKLDDALRYYEESLLLSKELKDTLAIASSLLSIGTIYSWRFKTDKALDYTNQSITLSRAINDKKGEAIALNNFATSYIQKKEYDKAKENINEAIKIGDSLNDYNLLSGHYVTLGSLYLKLKDYDEVIKKAEILLKYAQRITHNERIDGAYAFFLNAYKGKKDVDSIIKYYDLRKLQRTTLDDITSLNTLERIKIDNTRSKDSLISVAKELKLAIVNQKEKDKLTLAWGGGLSAVSIFAFLIFRNTKRKQHKAEEERQLQIEEKEKILKDLELSTIDAMIQGQEKERIRLAADLHDSVGSTLAAAKLQFNYLIKNQNNAKYSEELIKKTSTLLEDAYVEIRSMAHLKNSGVMAKNGLLPAVEKLSYNASGINGLTFVVQSFGLEQRLENTLEISIFRIIQELVTNVIKHANATKGIVHLTNHDDNLNIMIEDNGIGFDSKEITKTKKGMGLSSIDKRVDHLEGHFTIESEINKGTTVIIDIPL